MIKQLILWIAVVCFALNLCGCMVMMVAVAEKAEAKQTFNIPYAQALDIVKGVFKEQNIAFLGATIHKDIAEAKGKYLDGTEVKIFVRKVDDQQCYVSVIAGYTEVGEEDAQKILQAVIDHAKNL